MTASGGARRLGPIPVALGGAVLGGWLVLVGMWLAWGRHQDLPGLFHYPSAYLGDSLLLPTATVLLAAGVRQLPAARFETAVAVVAGLVAAAAGTATQLLWLADDAPHLNWTLPEPHRFNVAGLWHAAYVVVVATLLAMLAALLAWRMRAVLRRGDPSVVEAQLRGWSASLLLASLFAYATLVVHDSWSATLASLTSLVALATVLAALVLLVSWLLGRRTALIGRPVVHGLLAAAAAISAVTAPWSGEHLQVLGVVGAALSGVAVATSLATPLHGGGNGEDHVPTRTRLAAAALAAPLLVLLLPGLWVRTASAVLGEQWPVVAGWLAAYAVALAAVPAALFPGELASTRRWWWLWRAQGALFTMWFLGVVSLVALTAPHWHDSDTQYVVIFAVTVVTAGLLFPMVWRRYGPVIQAEQQPLHPDGTYEVRGSAKVGSTMTLLFLVVTGGAAGASLLVFTLAVAEGRELVPGAGALHTWPVVLAAAAGLMSVALWIVVRPPRTGWSRWTAALLALAWPAALALVAGVRVIAPVSVVAVLGGLVLGLWAANTAINNVALLNGDRMDAPMLLYAAAIGASGLVSGYAALTSALAESPDQTYTWYAGIGTALAILAGHGVATIAGGVLVSLPRRRLTRQPLPHNLLQDAVVMTFVYVIGLVVPAIVLLHLPGSHGVVERFAALIVISAPLLTFFLRVFLQVSETNLGHLEREITTRIDGLTGQQELRQTIAGERPFWQRNWLLLRAAQGRLDSSDQHAFLRVLGAHLRNQNDLAKAAGVVFVVGLFVLLGSAVHQPNLPGSPHTGMIVPPGR